MLVIYNSVNRVRACKFLYVPPGLTLETPHFTHTLYLYIPFYSCNKQRILAWASQWKFTLCEIQTECVYTKQIVVFQRVYQYHVCFSKCFVGSYNIRCFKFTSIKRTKRRKQVDHNPASYTGGSAFITVWRRAILMCFVIFLSLQVNAMTASNRPRSLPASSFPMHY